MAETETDNLLSWVSTDNVEYTKTVGLRLNSRVRSDLDCIVGTSCSVC